MDPSAPITMGIIVDLSSIVSIKTTFP